METLVELLCNRSGRDLFQLTRGRKLSLPGEWTDEEIQEIIAAYYSQSENEEYFLWVLQNWEDGEFDLNDDDPEDKRDDETATYQKEWMDRCLRIGQRLRSINEGKIEYATVLAEDMLKPESIQFMLLDLRDPCIHTLRDICADAIKLEDGYYPIQCRPEKNWQYQILETMGYALIRKTDAYDEEDDREHYTGICISNDVIQVIREVDTEELEKKRNLFRILDSLELIIQDYYDAAPIEIAHQIYSILRQQDIDKYPELSEEELDRAIVDYNAKYSGMLHNMRTFRGKRYMCNITEEEISDETSAEDSYLISLLELWEEREVEPYIPQLVEMQNYLEYGYWEARKPFKDLHQFVVEYYMDEQSMEEMGGGIFMMGMDPEERDEYVRKRHYSMDRVLEKADEEFGMLQLDLAGGNEPGDIYRNKKDFTCWLSDSAKRKFRRLLTKCSECVPLAWRLGNTLNSVST